MNFARGVSCSLETVGAMLLVSRRRRRKEVLPLRWPATIRV